MTVNELILQLEELKKDGGGEAAVFVQFSHDFTIESTYVSDGKGNEMPISVTLFTDPNK